MNECLNLLKQPWPWYVAGPLIGLMIPLLLIIGKKSFGISSAFRHICAACVPAKIPFFQYEWKKEAWNLFFVGGVFLGGMLSATVLASPGPIQVHPTLQAELAQYGITQYDTLVPAQLLNWENLLTWKGFLIMVVGGLMIGFGTRYAGGCTSGHAIMGISTLQWSSVIATCCFMLGGMIMANFILPFILRL